MVCDVNPIWLAQSKLRRRCYDDCIELCTAALQRNPLDQVSWVLGPWTGHFLFCYNAGSSCRGICPYFLCCDAAYHHVTAVVCRLPGT